VDKWIKTVISLLVQWFTFQLKTNDRVSTDLVCFFHANERRKSETKDSIHNTHLNFLNVGRYKCN